VGTHTDETSKHFLTITIIANFMSNFSILVTAGTSEYVPFILAGLALRVSDVGYQLSD
jgi:hypothetical protein